MSVIQSPHPGIKWLFLVSILAVAYFSEHSSSARLTPPATGNPPQLVLQTGHAMRVDGLAFTPDGQLVATGSADHTVKLWDVATNRELRTLTGHRLGVKAVAFSPDGRWLASGSIDGAVKLWDVATGREMKSIAGNGSVGAIAFSSDGRMLAVGNMEQSVRLFDVTSAALLRTFSGHTDAITTLAFNPDSRLLASGSADKTIMLWDVAAGGVVHTLKGHVDKISAVAFSPDNQLLASGSLDGKIKLWQTRTATEQRMLNGPAKPLAVTFSADSKSIFVAAANNTVKRWEVMTGRETRPIFSPDGQELLEAISMAFSPDGRWWASSSGDKTVQIRDLATGRNLHTLATHSYGVYSTVFSPNSKWFATGGKENTVKLWEVATGRELFTLDPNGGFVNTVAFSPDSKQLASGNLSGGIVLWDVETGRRAASFPAHSSSVNALAFSPDGKWLASGSDDQSVKLWDLATGREVRVFSGHTAEIYALAFRADGRLLASGGADKTIKIWDSNTGIATSTLRGHEGEVSAVVFDPNGKWLASASADKTVRIWDLTSGRQVKTLSGHADQVKALAISSDGLRLASGSADSLVKLWDPATGSETQTLRGHYSEVYSVAFSPDGHWLSSGSDDGSTHIWDARTGKLVATLVSLRENISGYSLARTDWLVVTPDGLFDGSPAAWKQILWRFDGNTLNVRSVEVFFNEFFHPGLLADILSDRHPVAPQDIAQIDRRQPTVLLKLQERRTASENVTVRDMAVRIEVAESPPDKEHSSGSGARDVRLFRNGSLAHVWRGEVLENKGGSVVLETTIPVIAGENELTAYAFNGANIKSPDATMTVTGADSLKRPATAYIVAVGVNTYANPGYNLKLAVPDASDFSNELRRSQESLLGRFQNIQVVPLLDQDATKANILLALKRLSGTEAEALPVGAPTQLEKLKPSQPEDTVVIYFAGHGLANQAQFYLLPHDLGYEGSRRRLNLAGLQTILTHSISDRELEQAFEKLQAGQILLVLDACNSGQALEAEEKRRGPMNSKGLAQLAYEKGMYILTAAQSYQAALEVTELGHGLLTYALVEEGLKKSLADTAPRDGRVLLQEWLDFATARVPELQQTKMRQGRSVGSDIAFVEGDEQLRDIEKRDLQRPRAFYRSDTPIPVIAIRTTSHN